MLSLLSERYPERRYTGIDFSTKMLEAARAKGLKNVTLVRGDCEQLPFETDSFDAVICSQSFHHYPNPQAFFNSVFRVLRPGGRLILRDMTMSAPMAWIANHLEMPLIHLLGHGDVRVYTCAEVRKLCENAGLTPETVQWRKGLRLHCVARKPVGARPVFSLRSNPTRTPRRVGFFAYPARFSAQKSSMQFSIIVRSQSTGIPAAIQ